MTVNWKTTDQQHIWHPYSAIDSNLPCYPVVSANGVRIKLENGQELIDGMSSWWSTIHGYNHPVLNDAIQQQLKSMSHVMFGGLTHQPAAELTERLLSIVSPSLSAVFFSDSGSVAVEVAMKMAIQYWHALKQPNKQRFMTIRGGYHGDTFGAMSVCDPVTGMHNLFKESITQQFFVNKPQCRYGEEHHSEDIEEIRNTLEKNHHNIAAFILEPIVQGAGGMYFYSASFLQEVRKLCDQYDVLLILDEIATGFGRTGKLFASQHADIHADILCLGKALTGGYMSLAATLTTDKISQTIQSESPHVFMHGPTFMANPLACSVANASLDLLLQSNWQENVQNISSLLEKGLSPCRNLEQVQDVRILGAIGVVELNEPVNMETIQPAFVKQDVWIRPFGKLIYLMPPYIIKEDDLLKLTDAVCHVVKHH